MDEFSFRVYVVIALLVLLVIHDIRVRYLKRKHQEHKKSLKVLIKEKKNKIKNYPTKIKEEVNSYVDKLTELTDKL
jgi:uncharacterized membrane-anchored protein YhcB (DUF1043 family)